MSLLSVVQEVCAAVGVARLTSVFSDLNNQRTQQEMLAVATEMAQRIANDERDWQLLRKQQTFLGDGVTEAFDMPADYLRMLKTSNVWRSTSAMQPMVFYDDTDEWLQRRALGYQNAWGEWTIFGGQMHIWPPLGSAPEWTNSTAYQIGDVRRDIHPSPTVTWWKSTASHTSSPEPTTFGQERIINPTLWVQTSNASSLSQTARFAYLDRNCVNLASGGVGYEFMSDNDTFRLNERLLRLGMIWQWKAHKGSPYAEDMATWMDAMTTIMGSDKPSPVIVDRLPISASPRASYPYPTPNSGDWSWPL